MVMSKTTAATSIYYPFLQVNESWLKLSLLYWDRVRRIVPEEVRARLSVNGDTSSVRRAVDAGALIDTDAAPYLKASETRFRESTFPFLRSNLKDLHAE